jgi:hypothetical protein
MLPGVPPTDAPRRSRALPLCSRSSLCRRGSCRPHRVPLTADQDAEIRELTGRVVVSGIERASDSTAAPHEA